jgi:ABC-type nitrate/sulfonate/bicarbonate transport system substrate-binding protein
LLHLARVVRRGRAGPVALNPYRLYPLEVVRLLEASGLTDKDVNLTDLDFGGMLSMLVSGKVDAADLVEPGITLGKAQGALKRWSSNAEISPGEQEAVLMITPKLAAATDVADRFILAYIRACEAIARRAGNQARASAQRPVRSSGCTRPVRGPLSAR